MTALVALLGVACVAIVIIDLLWTTVAAGAGGGPLTIRIANTLWFTARRLTGQRRHRLLQWLGVGVTATVVATWITLLLAGWYLVFSSAPEAVLDSSTDAAADGWSRLYYTGFTVFTLGIGDFTPGGAVWQIATIAATSTGLTLVTLAITYLLSVTTAVVQRRQLAAEIAALGCSPTDILETAWNGSQLQGLDTALQSLTPDIAQLAQRHLAFPVLHYFHSSERATAIAPSIAVLDELLTVIEHGLLPSQQPPPLTTSQLRNVITELLVHATGTSQPGPGQLSSVPPPMPSLEGLRRLGLPLTGDENWRAQVQDLASRRQRLSDFLSVDGWEWDDVWTPAPADPQMRDDPG